MCLAHGPNAVPLVRLEPATPRSRVNHSTTTLPWRGWYSYHGVYSIMVHQYCLGLLFSVLEGLPGKAVDHSSDTYCSNIVHVTNLAALR